MSRNFASLSSRCASAGLARLLRPYPPKRSHQRGVSLVEILISLALGLVLVGAAASLYLANHQTFRQVENLARINENARLAFELLGRDLREAGGIACGARMPLVNVLNHSAGAAWWDDLQQGLIGYDDAQALPARAVGSALGDRVSGTDAVVVWSSSLGPTVGISSHNPPSAQLQVSTTQHGLANGDIVMACDLRLAAIFQVTNANPANTTIVHNTGGSVNPGNCRKELGLSSTPPHDCSPGSTGSEHSFAPNGIITRLHAHAWYIGHNGRGGRSLFRIALGNSAGTAGAGSAEEMIENVSNLQLLFLERRAGTLGTSYVPASTAGIDWRNVEAVRLELSFVSAEAVGVGGATITRTLPFVVGLRNRLP